MSNELDPLWRNALVATVLETFEMIAGVNCKKMCDLTDWKFIVAYLIDFKDWK